MPKLKMLPCCYYCLLLCALLWAPSGTAGDSKQGAIVMLGDVLGFNQGAIWRGIVDLAGGSDADIVVIAAAHDRPELYGGYAERAFSRYAPFVELLPIAVSADKFGTDHRQLEPTTDLVTRIREADVVFFVGGAPQRLAQIMYNSDGSPTLLATAVRQVYADGGVVAGGIPGPGGAHTAIETLPVMEQGRLPAQKLYRGLNMLPEGWYVDQHFSSTERFAETLVAMRQLDMKYAVGVGNDAAAVLRDGQLSVIGKGGVVIVDLSAATSFSNGAGFNLGGVRLSYLEDGDSLDLATLQITPHPHKTEGFEIDATAAGQQPLIESGRVAADVSADNNLFKFLLITLDSLQNQTVDIVFSDLGAIHQPGFRLRFYTAADTRGWITTRSGGARFTAKNIYLDVAPITRKQTADRLP